MKVKSYSKVLKSALVLMLVFSLMVSLAGCGKGKDVVNEDGNLTDDPSKDIVKVDATYTLNEYMAGSPKVWNPHEWESTNDRYPKDYTTYGLYEFVFNDAFDAYTIKPEMAAAEPVDVTKEFAGNEVYGIPADAEEGYAFKIALNDKAVWENGDKINADSYIYSMQQLLDPKMKNFRASGYYSGTLTIANAEAYYKQSAPIYTDISKDDAYRDVADSDMKFSFTQNVVFFGDTAKKYYDNDSHKSKFIDEAGNDLFEKYSSQDYNDLTDEAKAELLNIAKAFGDTNPEAYKEFCFTYDGVSESVDWEKVGLKKTGDYELTLVLSKPITDFYLKYNLNSNWLVYEDLYEANKKETGDLIKTTYGTSADNYMSYGPYKLTEFQQDKQIIFEKNENWYGYTDGKHEGEYQTSTISTQIVSVQATALQLFLQGKLDAVDLTAEDMGAYRTSDYILYTPESYTTKFTFNTDKSALKSREAPGINRTILSYKDFRKAFSLSVDREEFAAQCTATHSAGFGLLNYLYIYDPETGASYRNSDQGKGALMKLYNADKEEDITGFDKDQAKELFTKVYNDALAAGDIKEGDKVELELLTYNSDATYVKMVNFIQDAISASTAGTPLENKVTIKMVPDEDYYDHAKQGAFEMIMSTWGGSSMDPYGIMEVYCDEDTKHEYGFKPNVEKWTINIDGKDITKTFNEWYRALVDEEYAAADADLRLQILASMELGLLETYQTTPIYYRTSTSLYSQKIEYPTYEFVQLLNFGGVREITYNYSDQEWTAYCEQNNNQLDY